MRIVGREGIGEAVALLRAGQVVAIPTETVYGLAGLATSEDALERIFKAKDRPTFDPLIVHVSGIAQAEALAGELTGAARDRARALAARFWPGPLTLVLPRGPDVPDLATSGLPTVALRCPRHDVALELVARAGPLAAPSANRFGRISPTSAADVVEELSGRVALVVDGGPCAVGVESSIVAIDEDGGLTLLRPGGVASSDLEAAAGAPLRRPEGGVLAPGMLPSHYAPRKRLVPLRARVADLEAPPPGELPARLGLLAFDDAAGERFARLCGRAVVARVLSPEPDEAARHLFAALRALDASDAELLFAEPVPVLEGLGHAIADRLGRAAAPGPAQE